MLTPNNSWAEQTQVEKVVTEEGHGGLGVTEAWPRGREEQPRRGIVITWGYR